MANPIKHIIDELKQFDCESIDFNYNICSTEYYFYSMKDENTSDNYYMLQIFAGDSSMTFYNNAEYFKINGNFSIDTFNQIYFNFCLNFIANNSNSIETKKNYNNFLLMVQRTYPTSNSITIYETPHLYCDGLNHMTLNLKNFTNSNKYFDFLNQSEYKEKFVYLKLNN